jgi:hypothetical protein
LTNYGKINRSGNVNYHKLSNLEIDIPKTQDPDGRDLGTAKWIVNGKVAWTTEMHKTES